MRRWLRGAPLLLALTAYASVGIIVLNPIFNTTSRWFFLGFLILALGLRGQLFLALRNPFLLAAWIFCGWGILTSLWSQVPQLSLYKSATYAVSVLAFVGAGQAWSRGARAGSLDYLFPAVALALLAGYGPGGTTDSWSNEVSLYAGLAGNPNFLGMLAALAIPVSMYYVYQLKAGTGLMKRTLAVVLFFALVMVVIRSNSRAALLCVLAIGASFLLAQRPDRRILLVLSACFAVVATIVAVPAIQQATYEKFVIKGADENSNGATNDVFSSRRKNWAESYDAAVHAGAFGVGFGVSAGDQAFRGGFTANLYGREKGNSQLAVWEETGFFGLLLYAAVLVQIALHFRSAYRLARSREVRMQLALAMGTLAGLLIQSVFEGWWTSPGSLEGSYFWSTVGVAAGLSERIFAARALYRRQFQSALLAEYFGLIESRRTT